MDKAERAAEFLDQSYRERRRYENLPPAIAPADLTEAYAIQRALQDRWKPRLGDVVGWKIAVTTPAMRRILNIPRPVVGGIFASRVHQCPTTFRAADFVHACIEFEIALRLATDLPHRASAYTAADVLPAVGAACPAFELVDDRFADYTTTQGLSLCADNAWNAGIACGQWVAGPAPSLLAPARGNVVFDGRELGEGESTPLDALAWLADELALVGLPLRRGMIVMTGSLLATQYPVAGSRTSFTAHGLGRITIDFE